MKIQVDRMVNDRSELAGYQQAWQSTAYYQMPHPGSFLIGGKDRESFIQRQTTNDIRLLKAGQALLTVLTSPTARILDVLYLMLEQDQIQALTLAASGEDTARYLKSRIFFMDQVNVVDTSAELARIHLVGPQIEQALNQAFGVSLPAIDQVTSLQVGDNLVRLLTGQPAILPGGVFIAPLAAVDDLLGRLSAAGAARLSTDSWEVLRVEAGLPGSSAELGEAYTPLEVGLLGAISDSKGCYTGQEIIARQITYDKVTQHLCGLRLGKLLGPGAQVRADGKKVGVLTSSVESPRYGPLGLAVLKRPYHEPDTLVELIVGEGEPVDARVIPLPLK